MPRISTITRVLLGLGFLVFSLNYFLPFLPAQEAPPPAAMGFIGTFVTSGFLTFVKVIELAMAILLLSNRFVPLATAVLAPIVVGIVMFHVLLAPAGMPIAGVFLALLLAVAWSYRAAYAAMLRARVEPAATTRVPAPVQGARSANVT
ncbi:MAG: DoxX family protein [Kofleriaceae bacterium]